LQTSAPNEALKRRDALTISFNLEVSYSATPTGKRGRHQIFSGAALQTCLATKILFNTALRQLMPAKLR
jgi:Transposase DDE domain